MSRIAVFIDGAYLDKIQKRFKVRVDFQKLSHELSKNGGLYRTYYYHCLPYQSATPAKNEAIRFSKAQKFFRSLDRLSRFQVRLGKLAYRGNNDKGQPIFEQKRVDILLGTDLVLLAAKQHITDAVIIAGDSDFLPAIEVAKAEGVVIRLYSNPQSIHTDLWNVADERYDIDQTMMNQIKI